jgi:hypothetical protein
LPPEISAAALPVLVVTATGATKALPSVVLVEILLTARSAEVLSSLLVFIPRAVLLSVRTPIPIRHLALSFDVLFLLNLFERTKA